MKFCFILTCLILVINGFILRDETKADNDGQLMRPKRQNYDYATTSTYYGLNPQGQVSYPGQPQGYNSYQNNNPSGFSLTSGQQYQQNGQNQQLCPCPFNVQTSNPSTLNFFSQSSTISPYYANQNLCPCSTLGQQQSSNSVIGFQLPAVNPTQVQSPAYYPTQAPFGVAAAIQSNNFDAITSTTPGFPFNIFAPLTTTTPAPFPMNIVNQLFPPITTTTPYPFPFNFFQPKPTVPPLPFPLSVFFPTTQAPFFG